MSGRRASLAWRTSVLRSMSAVRKRPVWRDRSISLSSDGNGDEVKERGPARTGPRTMDDGRCCCCFPTLGRAHSVRQRPPVWACLHETVESTHHHRFWLGKGRPVGWRTAGTWNCGASSISTTTTHRVAAERRERGRECHEACVSILYLACIEYAYTTIM